MVVRFSLDIHEITPSRCKARNCRHGFYFDPVTFEALATPADAIFSESESPEEGDADGVDEVLSDPLSLTTADNKSQIHRLLEFVLPSFHGMNGTHSSHSVSSSMRSSPR